MADEKISDLTAVTTVLSTDEYVLARSGATNKITGADLIAGIGAGTGALSFITEMTAPGGGSANFDFTSISGSFRHLELWGVCQSEGASGDVLMRFNNDSGANYALEVHRGSGATSSAATLSGQTAGNIASVSATGDSYPSRFVIRIPYYSESAFNKQAISEYSNLASGTTTVGKFMVAWANTAAITRITLFISGGVDLKVGSTVSLYGVT